MKDELLRILRKDGWDIEDVEDLIVILEDEKGLLKKVSPDILELSMKELFFGKGNENRRIERASMISNLPPEFLRGILSFLKGKRKAKHEEGGEIPFKDLIDSARRIKPWKLYEDFLGDLKAASDLSDGFRRELSLAVHPYISKVVLSRRSRPLVVDGNNFLWKHDLCIKCFEDLFLALSNEKRAFYPVYIVFDGNVEHIVPKSGSALLEDILSSKFTYRHSPADELIISLARQKNAVVMSEDRFREYGFEGERIGYPV